MTLNDPPANTYTYEMMRDLDDAILQARFDENVHVIVLRGAGEKFFCAGANINMLKTVNPTFKYYFCLHANETLNRLEQTPKLVIAALNGHTRRRRPRDRDGGRPAHRAQGRGQGRPARSARSACCPAPAARSAWRGSSASAKAIELMVTGETFAFEKALRARHRQPDLGDGDDDEFIDKIQKYAEQFCPPNKAAKAVGRIKRAVQIGRRGAVRERAGDRARAAAAAVPERGREGRPRRLRREAQARVQGEVVAAGACPSGPSPRGGGPDLLGGRRSPAARRLPGMKCSVFIATSFDGFIAREDGALDWLPADGDVEEHGYDAFIATVDVLVMGRLTYETVLGFDAWPFGAKPVVVLSSRPIDVPEPLRGTVEASALAPRALVAALAERGFTHAYVDGGRTIQGFLRDGLIQRIVVTRIPVLLGRGIPLFGPLAGDVLLRHVATQSWPSGLVQSTYDVAPPT